MFAPWSSINGPKKQDKSWIHLLKNADILASSLVKFVCTSLWWVYNICAKTTDENSINHVFEEVFCQQECRIKILIWDLQIIFEFSLCSFKFYVGKQTKLSLKWCFLISFQGFCVLRPTTASQQAHPASVHGQPRAVHAPPQARQHRGSADEGSGQRREAEEEDGEVEEELPI